MTRARLLLALTLALPTLAACAGPPIPPVMAPVVPPPSTPGRFRAGVADVDVTPHPGLGTFGHGPDAREARGHRGRLHCRVLYLEDERGERVALVPCDFAAMDVHLQRMVADMVDDEVMLGADRLILSATHTHGGPANYFFSLAYSGLLSSQARGYDEAFTRWVARRIADGIEAAFHAARPARIAWISAHLNTGADGSGPSIGQNRSVFAHCGNPDPMNGGPTTCRDSAPDPIAEVEGRLSLLRVDAEEEGGLVPLGLYATYPVHGTAVPNTNAYFEGDLWGFAARRLEAELGEGRPFVAALANGAEGDVRPSSAPMGWDEARRLGELLAERIAAAYRGPFTYDAAPHVDVVYEDLPLREAEVPSTREHLCSVPEYGASAPGGSEEGRTSFYGRGMHEGLTGRDRGACRGRAHRFFGAFLVRRRLPAVAPLALVGVGRGVIAAIPWEMTTTAGLQLQATIAARVPGEVVGIAGLANEYLQYLTTPEEYDHQNYEGASDIFGRPTFTLVRDTFARLADALVTARSTGARHVVMQTIQNRRGPEEASRFDLGARALPPRIDEDHSGPVRFEGHDAIAVRFAAGAPGSLGIDRGAVARVEVRDATGRFVPATRDGRPLDDTSEDLVLQWLDASRRAARRIYSVQPALPAGVSPRDYADLYRVLWIPGDDTPAGTYRIVITSAGASHAARPMTWPAHTPR